MRYLKHILYGEMLQPNLQYNTVQYSAVQCSAAQRSAVQYSTVQRSAVQYSTIVLSSDGAFQWQYKRAKLIKYKEVVYNSNKRERMW